MKYFKLCPKCSEKQVYSCKSTFTKSVKENKICLKCLGKSKRKHNGIFQRICKCGKTLNYSCRQSLNLAIKHNSVCRNCSTKESAKHIDRSFMYTEEYKEKQRKSHIGMIFSDETKEKIRIATKRQWNKNRDKMLSIFRSGDYIEKQIKSQKIKWSDKNFKERMKLIHNSDEYKEKRRKITLKIIKNKCSGKLSQYNPNACKYIDKFNKENGCNLQHALNGGEFETCGYLLDGYDKEKNIVFEYDESNHYYSNDLLKPKDIYRQNIIIKMLNPIEFWRYNERKGVLCEVISGRRIDLCPPL